MPYLSGPGHPRRHGICTALHIVPLQILPTCRRLDDLLVAIQHSQRLTRGKDDPLGVWPREGGVWLWLPPSLGHTAVGDPSFLPLISQCSANQKSWNSCHHPPPHPPHPACDSGHDGVERPHPYGLLGTVSRESLFVEELLTLGEIVCTWNVGKWCCWGDD